MKKSIVMALIVLAIIAGPVFAGEFGHQIVLDTGFGINFEANDGSPAFAALTDGASRVAISGTLDDNNSIYFQLDMGGIDLTSYQKTMTDSNGDTVGVEALTVGEFTANSNILGALGVADSPVTLNLEVGYGRLELHNRFNQWTGWEWTVRKDTGDPLQYGRNMKMALTANIMGYVQVKIGVIPDFNQAETINMLVDVWGSVAAGPVGLDWSVFLVSRAVDGWWEIAGGDKISLGGEVQANMAFGPVNLMVAVNEVLFTDTDPDTDVTKNNLMIALKPSIAAGPVNITVGAWMGLSTTVAATTTTTAAMALDLQVAIAMITIFGGVRMNDLENAADTYVYEFGAKVGFGATSMTLGLNGGPASGGAAGDMMAVDNTTGIDGENPVLYVKFSTQMW